MRGHIRRLTLCAALTAAAFALSYLESMIPLPMPLPGMKLGLANLVTLLALYSLTLSETALIVLARCLLTALLFGGPTQLIFSLSGGLLSLLTMRLLRDNRFLSPFGVSMAGSAAHNTAQVIAAALMLRTPSLRLYLVWLYPVSILTGFLIALVYRLLAPRIRPAFPPPQ